MSRARLLKPGFFTNEDLAQVSLEARLLFAGLWTLADREGRLEDRPLRIKAQLFPYDDVKVNERLEELASIGVILRYEVGEYSYIAIPSFLKHQKPHPREQESVIPGPEATPRFTLEPMTCDSTEKSPAVPIAVSDPDPDPDPVPVAEAALAAPAASRRLIKPRSEEWNAEVEALQAENPDVDVGALAEDYLNWTGSAKHTDKLTGLRNQLRLPYKRQQFAREKPMPWAETLEDRMRKFGSKVVVR